jgi:hypothetical protein
LHIRQETNSRHTPQRPAYVCYNAWVCVKKQRADGWQQWQQHFQGRSGFKPALQTTTVKTQQSKNNVITGFQTNDNAELFKQMTISTRSNKGYHQTFQPNGSNQLCKRITIPNCS